MHTKLRMTMNKMVNEIGEPFLSIRNLFLEQLSRRTVCLSVTPHSGSCVKVLEYSMRHCVVRCYGQGHN